MKRETLINNCMFCHNFLEESFLRPLMPIYKLDIIGSYEEPCLLLFPQEKIADKEQKISCKIYFLYVMSHFCTPLFLIINLTAIAIAIHLTTNKISLVTVENYTNEGDLKCTFPGF